MINKTNKIFKKRGLISNENYSYLQIENNECFAHTLLQQYQFYDLLKLQWIIIANYIIIGLFILHRILFFFNGCFYTVCWRSVSCRDHIVIKIVCTYNNIHYEKIVVVEYIHCECLKNKSGYIKLIVIKTAFVLLIVNDLKVDW